MQTSLGNQMVNPSKCQMISNFRSFKGPPNKRVTPKTQLLPEIKGTTNLQLEPDKPKTTRSNPDADIPQEVRSRLKELLNAKYTSIVSKSAMDIGRTNLIELDIMTEGPPITLRPYTVPLK